MIPECCSSCKHQKVKVQAFPCCGCLLNPNKWFSGPLRNYTMKEELLYPEHSKNILTEEPKYMVFVPGGPYAPRKVFTLEQAQREAQQMADKYITRSKEVFICKIVGKIVEVPRYQYEEIS